MFYELLRLLAFSAGTVFLAVTLLLTLMVVIAHRHHHLEWGEGFLGNFFCLSAFSVSVMFFVFAMNTPI